MWDAAPQAAAARGRPLRLPRLGAAARQIGNHLLGRAAVCDVESPGKALIWRWHAAAPAQTPALTLCCAAGDLRCALAFDADDGPGLDDGIDLEAFDGAALQAAAAIRYAAVLAHLERIGGRRFDDVRMHRGSHRLDAEALTIGFALADLTQVTQATQAAQAAQSPRALTGTLQVLPSQAAFWSRVQGRAAAMPLAVANLPVAGNIWLAQSLAAPAASLRRLRVGGALLLGPAQHEGLACRVQWPGAHTAWSALHSGQRLQLRAPLDTAHQPPAVTPRSAPMDAQPDHVNHEPSDASPAFDAMPIALDFHLGQVSMPLSALSAALAPGYVIELGRPLDSSAVSVRANGQLLAHGELIQVGDQLAVRISRIASDANSDGSV
jgi:flagellar motor switch/type III secretory pathway protein FliN